MLERRKMDRDSRCVSLNRAPEWHRRWPAPTPRRPRPFPDFFSIFLFLCVCVCVCVCVCLCVSIRILCHVLSAPCSTRWSMRVIPFRLIFNDSRKRRRPKGRGRHDRHRSARLNYPTEIIVRSQSLNSQDRRTIYKKKNKERKKWITSNPKSSSLLSFTFVYFSTQQRIPLTRSRRIERPAKSSEAYAVPKSPLKSDKNMLIC